jgi:hypothetical protein
MKDLFLIPPQYSGLSKTACSATTAKPEAGRLSPLRRGAIKLTSLCACFTVFNHERRASLNWQILHRDFVNHTEIRSQGVLCDFTPNVTALGVEEMDLRSLGQILLDSR